MNRLFVENLTVIDFAYLDPRRGLVGESWIADLELGGRLDDQGMVFDFGNIKRTIKRVIDEDVDHRLLIPVQAPSLELHRDGDRVTLAWHLAEGGALEHRSPPQAVVLLEAAEVTPAVVEELLVHRLRQILPDNIEEIRIRLREEVIDGPYYHYVHGLKKHRGNCQRIAHGHRSRLEIHRDGDLDPELIQQWADRWRDIYIGTREDVVEETQDSITFAYEAAQGEFRLSLPRNRVYLIDTDSTVEWIADHLADASKALYPQSQVQVRAFEGVGKGAIAER